MWQGICDWVLLYLGTGRTHTGTEAGLCHCLCYTLHVLGLCHLDTDVAGFAHLLYEARVRSAGTGCTAEIVQAHADHVDLEMETASLGLGCVGGLAESSHLVVLSARRMLVLVQAVAR